MKANWHARSHHCTLHQYCYTSTHQSCWGLGTSALKTISFISIFLTWPQTSNSRKTRSHLSHPCISATSWACHRFYYWQPRSALTPCTHKLKLRQLSISITLKRRNQLVSACSVFKFSIIIHSARFFFLHYLWQTLIFINPSLVDSRKIFIDQYAAPLWHTWRYDGAKIISAHAKKYSMNRSLRRWARGEEGGAKKESKPKHTGMNG